MTRRLTTEEFIHRSSAVHNQVYDYTETKYYNAKTKVSIGCNRHGSFLQTPDKHLSGTGCPNCADEVRATFGQRIRPTTTKTKTTQQFVCDSIQIFGDVYSYKKTVYERVTIPVIITCHIHGDFNVTPNNHLASHRGCPQCSKHNKVKQLQHDVDSFVSFARKVHGNLYDYDLVAYDGIDTKVSIVCHTHGIFFQTPKRHLYNASGCPKCSYYISRGERHIINILTTHKINFVRQKKFDGLLGDHRQLAFDFYLPHFNLLIEYNGEQHYHPTNIRGRLTETQIQHVYERTIKYDKIKLDFVQTNNFNWLIIPYTIKSIRGIENMLMTAISEGQVPPPLCKRV
jgi:hypothetical protein